MKRITNYSNMYDPMSGDIIQLQNSLPANELPPIRYLSKLEFESIVVKDPLTLYYVDNNNTITVFKGDSHIPSPLIQPPKYMLGLGDDPSTYVIYQNYDTHNKCLPIGKYKNIEDALKVLSRYTEISSNSNISHQIYLMLMNYIENGMSLNDAIIGTLSSAGYKDDSRLQELLTFTRCYPTIIHQRVTTDMYRIIQKFNGHPNYLFRLYSEIFNVFIKYEFFKGETSEDLRKPIADIQSILYS